MARSNRKRAQGRRGSRPAPSPLGHATPDAELAEAQLALGRPEMAEVPSEAELDQFEEDSEGRGNGGGGALAAPGSRAVQAPRASLITRLADFIRGSWRELQRVQWPDRRQVMQATGVVIGFVIVAGAFLGVASFAAQKIVNLILYGHG